MSRLAERDALAEQDGSVLTVTSEALEDFSSGSTDGR
jgi:hypothetical protein